MKNSITLLSLMFCMSLFSQEKRVEEVYQDCIYNTFQDKGVFLKKQMKNYEKYLISDKFLKDSTAKSYYNFLVSFSTRKKFPSEYKYSFFDSIQINSIEMKKVFPSNKECSKSIENHSGYVMLKAKIDALTIIKPDDLRETLKIYAELVSEDDFKLDYYKLRTLFFSQLFVW